MDGNVFLHAEQLMYISPAGVHILTTACETGLQSPKEINLVILRLVVEILTSTFYVYSGLFILLWTRICRPSLK